MRLYARLTGLGGPWADSEQAEPLDGAGTEAGCKRWRPAATGEEAGSERGRGGRWLCSIPAWLFPGARPLLLN